MPRTEENGTNERGGLANETFFRAHWLLLNAAFVMEFFAQTLVKKKKLSQKNMLRSNAALMATSSVAAVYVISRTSLVASVTSLTLNLVSPAREARSVAIASRSFWLLQRRRRQAHGHCVASAARHSARRMPGHRVRPALRATGARHVPGPGILLP